jgi:gp16 family phage-associated protein
MARESLFDPIPKELLRAARSRLALAGDSVADWATREGFNAKLAYDILSGRRMAIRGLSLQIAIKLELRPDPSKPTAQHDLPTNPAGRTLAGGPSVASCDRRPNLQLGEAAR